MYKRPDLTTLSNGHVTLDLDPETGRLSRISTDTADLAASTGHYSYVSTLTVISNDFVCHCLVICFARTRFHGNFMEKQTPCDADH